MHTYDSSFVGGCVRGWWWYTALARLEPQYCNRVFVTIVCTNITLASDGGTFENGGNLNGDLTAAELPTFSFASHQHDPSTTETIQQRELITSHTQQVGG